MMIKKIYRKYQINYETVVCPRLLSYIMRAFVRLLQMLSTNAELSRKLASPEKKYDIQFKAIFVGIRELMTPLEPKKKRPIGFAPWEKK
ncbi:MAG: hypothetical protein WCE58_04545 [Gallionella sp.]